MQRPIAIRSEGFLVFRIGLKATSLVAQKQLVADDKHPLNQRPLAVRQQRPPGLTAVRRACADV